MNDELIREIMIGQKPLKNTNELLLKKEIIRLNEEIEELKVEIKELNDDNVWWTNRFNAVESNNRELLHKSHSDDAIITKAIEYINNCEDMSAVNDYSFSTKPIIDNQAKKELLDILQGSDKE